MISRRGVLLSPLAQTGSGPRAVATQLAGVYGQRVTDAVYTQTWALVGRIRLGQAKAVKDILEPYLDDSRDSLAKATASHYSGHLVFADLASADPRARKLTERTAAMASERPLDSEMSDSVFMVCPLLVRAGLADRAAEHFAKMEGLCLRRDGLYRHSPLAEIAWGRGNGFPMLGLALSLTDLPKGHGARSRLTSAFGALADRLVREQRNDGMWRQVIDHAEAWPEYSCTAMIAASMQRGVSKGWLPRARFRPAIERAWRAIEARTGADGSVDGVCESTGKLASLDAYLQRRAIKGIDPRGGAMGLYLATELL